MLPLAAVQYRPPKGDPGAARQDLARLIGEAGERGARLVVCPEMATSGYVWESPEEIRPHCERPDGPTFQSLSPVAARHRAWVVVGFPELGADGLYNSALWINPAGELAGCYRKKLLYSADMSWAKAGSERRTFQTELGRVCPAICMDLNDYAFGIYLRTTRPEIVAFCTNWVDEGKEVITYWQEQLAGWRGWFVAANTWGEDRGVPFRGFSAILKPGGQVAAIGPATGDMVLLSAPP